ncbi:MAG: hypothetical protein ACPG06_06390 [Alphaproteobacteria bacterium]
MAFTKSIVATVTALGLLSAPTSAADLFGTYGASESATMVSYSLPFGGTAKSMDEPAFALSIAGGTEASINTDFAMDSLTLNGMNVVALNDRLNANDDDDSYMPLIALSVVIGGALLVASQDDNEGEKKVCQPGQEMAEDGYCRTDGGGVLD